MKPALVEPGAYWKVISKWPRCTIQGALFQIYQCQNVDSTWDCSGCQAIYEHDLPKIEGDIIIFCQNTEPYTICNNQVDML